MRTSTSFGGYISCKYCKIAGMTVQERADKNLYELLYERGIRIPEKTVSIPVANGVKHQLRLRLQSELLHQVRAMRFGGPPADKRRQ